MKMEARKMALDKVYKRRNRYDIPEWQRDDVWSVDRKQSLIDSILRGWKLPKLYFSKTADNPVEYEVVDGQQRMAAIFDFFDGQLELSADSAAKFGGSTYGSLPDVVTDRFDDFEIEYDEITEATDDEIQMFFQRLQGGMQLTAAEKLNAVRSEFTKFARILAGHAFFKDKVAIRDSRKAYFDIAAKAAAIEAEGLDVGLRYDDLKNVLESRKSFSHQSNVALRLQATLDYLNTAIPESSKILRNRSTIQSFITLAAEIIKSGKADETQVAFNQFLEDFDLQLARQVELGQDAKDIDYLEYQRTLSANVKIGAKKRHEILLRKLLLFNPSWTEVLGAETVALSGMSADIDRLGRLVASLVEKRNEEYSAINGADLFKATNKTVSALGRLREPVSDFKSYSRLIDDLYFVFREGPGQRLAGNVPESFEDINLLRTGLQHDVDHGKAGRVESKRKLIGSTFSKYSAGETSPAALAPERFPVVQAALLKSIVEDLENLSVAALGK